MLLYVLAGSFPLWFIPLPVGIELGREVSFGIIILLAAILLLSNFLVQGEIRYRYSPLLGAGVVLILVSLVSTFFSKAPLVSALFSDFSAEKLSTIALGVLLMVIISGVLRSSGEIGAFLLILFCSGAVSALITFIQLLAGVSLYHYLFSFAQGADFNAVGTINGLALFYGALFLIGIGIFISRMPATWKPWLRFALAASLVVFLLDMLLINFKSTWIMLLGTGIFLFALVFRHRGRAEADQTEKRNSHDWRSGIVLGLLIFSLVLLFLPNKFIQITDIPTEVFPSFTATVRVVQSVFHEGVKTVLVGSGPSTFTLDWALYKDPAVNQTVFGQVRFGQGFSFLSSTVATTGIIGLFSFLLFLAVSFALALQRLLFSKQEEGFSTAAFLGFVALTIAAGIYPMNFSLMLFFFLMTGVLLAALAAEHPLAVEGSLGGMLRTHWREIVDHKAKFSNPWAIFLSSLVIIFVLSLGIAGLYFEVERGRVAFAQQEGIAALNRGDTAGAVSRFEYAIAREENDFRNHQALTQIRTEQVRNLIQRASGGERVEQEFQSTVLLANQNSQRAIQLFDAEPSVWRTRGVLYEIILPFLPGADTLALASYQKAAERDPKNPVSWLDIGRVNLIRADQIQLVLNRAGQSADPKLIEARASALHDAERAFQKSIEVKLDFAQAHFLLAQTLIRLGNLQSAIQSVENTKLLAPLDIGVAFQLGLLYYYQQNELGRAESEFLRAVSLNENYSNARYFLGLIYDKNGEREKAIAEFEKIRALNPDNQEVAKILINLREKKPALFTIAPPGVAPEKRKEVPVKERR